VIAARRFFVEGRREVGATVSISGADARKIVRVLRLRSGDRIELVDSAARTFTAAIENVGHTVTATIVEQITRDERHTDRLQIDVAQAVPKGPRMDYVVEKCTELGARSFLVFYSERSVGRSVSQEKLARWRRIAKTAAQQCGRVELPEILTPIDFAALVERFSRYDVVLFAWEMAQPVALYQRLLETLPRAGNVLVVVGPEGGFTHNEAEIALTHGAALVWLGPRILRTDTAAVVLLAVIGAFAS
jgi:16S rRNA (uracil1498-N3)-methyltransferase